MKSHQGHMTGYFKAISQAFFFQNAYFGAIVMALFLVFDRVFFLCGMTGALVGYIYSVRHSTPKVLRDWGLITINGLFFGIAMASLFKFSVALVICVAVGALSIPLLTKAFYEVFQHWKLSPVIAPYIFVVWTIWLCGRGLAMELKPQIWPDIMGSLPSLHPQWGIGLKLGLSAFTSMGRLLFLPHPVFGLGILLLITAFSPRRGLFFFLGTALATLLSYLISSGSPAWEYGYFNYSAGLIGLGLASFPEMFAARTILLFCTLSCFLAMAAEQICGSLHVPTLSLPYVITLWVAMLSRVPRVSVNWSTSVPKYSGSVAQLIRSRRESVLVEEKVS